MTNSERITTDVTSWPGVTSGYGKRGEFGFYVGRREIGHLHGDRVAHFGFPKDVAAELKAAGRITDHPIGGPGLGARELRDDDDVTDVIALMRLNYDRVTAARTAGV